MKKPKSRKKVNPSKSNTDYMNQVQKNHEVRRMIFNKSYFGSEYINRWNYEKHSYYL